MEAHPMVYTAPRLPFPSSSYEMRVAEDSAIADNQTNQLSTMHLQQAAKTVCWLCSTAIKQHAMPPKRALIRIMSIVGHLARTVLELNVP
jgi:hypothetical protein